MGVFKTRTAPQAMKDETAPNPIEISELRELVDFLIGETSEDAVFSFLTAISCFGIESREDAVTAMGKDFSVRQWARLTARRIPPPNALEVIRHRIQQ